MLVQVLCAVALVQLVLGQAPQVTTSQGTMRGKVLKSRDGRDYFSFTKIPYAKPPIGKLRFMISEKADIWTGILDATQPIPHCYQPNIFGTGNSSMGQEDCLYLNIFTPNLTKQHSVIFSIHGGAFMAGSADMFAAAEYFMDEDVVFVAPNYRVGPLGFLSLEDNVIPGNMGLKDQALALEWVQKEISAFGGDPKQITVIGESAGGVSSDLICSVPRTNGIMKACVSESGVGSAPWGIMPKGSAREMALNMAKALDCNITRDILECLQSQPVEKVGNIGLMMGNNTPDLTVPVLEPVGAPGALLTRWPTGTDHSYPWIIGLCQDDGSVVIESRVRNKEEEDKYIKNFNQSVISDYHLENRSSDFQRIIARFFKEGVEPLTAIRNYLTESSFFYPALESLRDHPGPTYFFKFNYTRGPNKPRYKEVPHGAEMAYLFKTKSSVPDWPNAKDIELSRMLVKMLANFAKYHNPSIPGTQDWPQFQGQYYLDIQDSGVTISNWTNYQEIIDFWKSIEGQSRSGSTRSQSSLFVAALCIFMFFKTIII